MLENFMIKDIYIHIEDIYQKNERKILGAFALANTTELPVLKKGKCIGIVDIITFMKKNNELEDAAQILDENIVTFEINQNIEYDDYYKQNIFPVINKKGVYIGFVKKESLKIQQETHRIEHQYLEEIQNCKDIQEEFNAIFQSSNDSILVTDGDGIILRLNPACERIEEVSAHEVVGKHAQELVDKGLYSESVTVKVLEQKKLATILQKVRNGKEVIATGTPIFKNGEIFRVVTNSRDITELNNLKKELSEVHQLVEILRSEQTKIDDIIVSSPNMKKIIMLAIRVASVDSTVLIEGESGVGKEEISKLIHRNSKRKNGPFIKIDCGAIPEALLESELFGYEKGSFTSASKEGKIGLIEFANGGTLFLDEIGELPLNLQVKLLRLIQDREINRIGGKKPISVDIRIIAATNRNLKTMTNEKTFRKDLYYRLNVVPIYIPSLNQRKEEIEPIIMNCEDKFNEKYHLNKKIKPDAIAKLVEYDWPGNVRELENVVERLIVTAASDEIGIEDLPSYIYHDKKTKESILNMEEDESYKEMMEKCEKQLLLNALQKSNNTQEMAELLKVDRSTITRKLKRYKIKIDF